MPQDRPERPDLPDLPDRPVGELTKAIAAGSGEALTWLYRSRFDTLVAFARTRTRRDEAFCLDLVQETFLRVIRSLPTLDSEAQLDAWLLRTLERCAIDALRREQRRRRREDAAGARNPDGRGGSAHGRGEEPAGLRERLSLLPSATRDLLEARFRFGWTLSRIGATIGLAPGAVDGRISRALDRLRAELDDDHA